MFGLQSCCKHRQFLSACHGLLQSVELELEGCAGNEEFVEVEMSVAAVEQALDDVRPYLIADGGNVEVAEISDGIVRLRLQVRHPRAAPLSSASLLKFTLHPISISFCCWTS